MKTNLPTEVLIKISNILSPFIEITPRELNDALTTVRSTTRAQSLEKALTPKTFCELAGISVQTLWNWEKSGKIQLSRIARTVRVPRSEADRIINGKD